MLTHEQHPCAFGMAGRVRLEQHRLGVGGGSLEGHFFSAVVDAEHEGALVTSRGAHDSPGRHTHKLDVRADR
jgi:hypothetical protein